MVPAAKVLVGIVTFNRKEKLIKTLDECRRLGFVDMIVLDNGSTDGTREFLSEHAGIRYIYSGTNVGGSGGFNRIMRYFIEDTVNPWLLMFDDDAYPTFTFDRLARFLQFEQKSPHPAYTFCVTYPDGTLCEMNRPGWNVLTMNPLRGIGKDFHVDENSSICSVDFASFVGLLLKRETIQAVGIVSKEFFIYSDDTYYTLSISQKIGQISYRPDFVLVHDCRRSSRNLIHHDPIRLERDVINKVVMIREYSRFPFLYSALYLVRLLCLNPKCSLRIFRAFIKGTTANLHSYKNEAI